MKLSSRWFLVVCALATAPWMTSPAFAQDMDPEAGEGGYSGGKETVCDDKQDNDGDSMTDCADADCFDFPTCQEGGSEERSNERCSDWIDNDGDGLVDCDDSECNGPGITVCSGSADGKRGGALGAGGGAGSPEQDFNLPELQEGMTVDDLIGAYGDKDGERSDELCSDGIDNDGDGRTDCQDFGCRFDTSVSVCAPSPEFRFSIVAGMGAIVDMSDLDNVTGDARFTRVQARALGPIPLIDNSFFLLSMRLERTPRLTFAMFQVPIGHTGHYFQVNSGGGNLSSGLIISLAKQPLLEAPFYLFNAFEQGNGAVAEVGGPITSNNTLRYRAFVAGGSGVSSGNVGGRFFRNDDRNFNYAFGAQLAMNLIGYYDRFDTRYLYTPVPTTLGLQVGAKYDQRSRERYPAGNVLLAFRSGPVIATAETYAKYVWDYEAYQIAWNAMAGVLLWEKNLFLAADVGSYKASEFKKLPVGGFDSELRRPLDEFQFRTALHWYYWRNIGVLTLLYKHDVIEKNPDNPTDPRINREIHLETQFRF
ncbi:MAG: hypothetical protein KC417_13980 [Myxococcales bacterium]|nr:hypothetical protein [Myxococcales bacterium]